VFYLPKHLPCFRILCFWGLVLSAIIFRIENICENALFDYFSSRKIVLFGIVIQVHITKNLFLSSESNVSHLIEFPEKYDFYFFPFIFQYSRPGVARLFCSRAIFEKHF